MTLDDLILETFKDKRVNGRIVTDAWVEGDQDGDVSLHVQYEDGYKGFFYNDEEITVE